MNYAIIENEKEKLYHVEECIDPHYWYDKKCFINKYLHDNSYNVHMLDYSKEENERIKARLLQQFKEWGYREILLTGTLIRLESKARDEYNKQNIKKRR